VEGDAEAEPAQVECLASAGRADGLVVAAGERGVGRRDRERAEGDDEVPRDAAEDDHQGGATRGFFSPWRR
jgi:hypothetical protein